MENSTETCRNTGKGATARQRRSTKSKAEAVQTDSKEAQATKEEWTGATTPVGHRGVAEPSFRPKFLRKQRFDLLHLRGEQSLHLVAM